MALDTTAVRAKAQQFLTGFSAGQKAVVVIAVVGVVIGGMTFMRWAGTPAYSPLYSNLDPGDAASITEKLTSRNVPYKLADGGGTVMVPQKDVYQLRLDMSAAGLPAGGQGGYSLLDKQGITTSEFRQRVDYQRAMEGELSRTVGAIDGVAAATVHLVIPADDLFSNDERKPSASVLIKTQPGKSLSPGSVQAIVHLVSSSIEGMTPEQVTVADAKGQVLNAPGQAGADSLAGDARAGATRTLEENLALSSQDMLAKVLGPGRAVVRVSADLDFDQRRRTSESYETPTTLVPISESTSSESFEGTGSPQSGVLGPSATPVATGGNSTYSKEDATRNYAIGKTVEEITGAPGQIKRLSVAVLLDSKAKGVDTQTVERLVAAATGLDTNRGDTIAVDRMPFDDTVEKEAAKELQAVDAARKRDGMVSVARTGAAILLVTVAMLWVLRSSRKVRRTPVALPIDVEALLAPPVAEIEPPGPSREEEIEAAISKLSALQVPTAITASPTQRQIGELVDRQPEQVAQLLRSWLADRRST